jgi:hypothetical protein
MEASLALTIIGTILILVGLIFNAIPVLVNKQVMGDLAEEAVNPAAALRTILGGSAIACLFTKTGIALKMSPTKIRMVPMMVKAKLASILTPYLKYVDKLSSVLNRTYLQYTQIPTNKKTRYWR